jgi:RluA family pseudouridine synthase
MGDPLFQLASLRQSKLLPFLRLHLADRYSVKQLKRFIDHKRCRVNGYLEWISTRLLKAGDLVSIDCSPLAPFSEIPVLYEDDDLILVNKPSGMLCSDETIRSHFPKIPQLRPVHRLDKETSGVWIVVKSAHAAAELKRQFVERKIGKGYLALVKGKVESAEGMIDNYVERKDYKTWHIAPKGRGVRAITRWKRIHADARGSYLLCEPLTGRTHQIRIHMRSIGHPILGDVLYTQQRRLHVATRLLLHAYWVQFDHPTSGKKLHVTAPLPEDFPFDGEIAKNNEKCFAEKS